MSRKTVDTTWNMRTYDVLGNAKDGYQVNDSFDCGDVSIRCRIEHYNVGTDREFSSASPSDYQLRRVFGVRCRIDVDGDDRVIYVNRAKDGFPIGELYCVSHESLSSL